ncbi:MarR family winged helix-turn-helix transcriptional regulator [Amnibacterium flavum]|uniref:HTH marR-type domain-containing protein n=1 Tax=Amnibacterium flavum TaxID=2173173 RepID=A0A2V1HY39_9MICO|nr:MarR family transcriptional regulator [Amnibacterium flavum]PVZ95324.1 hypothetical protein DDQ50_02035 [Amnibacterium flavum]
MRLILERAKSGDPISPKEIAEHLQITSASVSALIQRLERTGLAHSEDHPGDRRRKLVIPDDTTQDPDDVDPLTARIRDLANDLSPEEAELVSLFLRRVTEEMSREC